MRHRATPARVAAAGGATLDPLAERTIDSPVGPLHLVADAHAIRALQFTDLLGSKRASIACATDLPPSPAALAWLDVLERELGVYFTGRRHAFSLPLAPRGTPFQQRVWQALLAIPWGATASYGAIARSIGSPAAARAVGRANHENPIAIVIPCHRVIGASRQLVGYGGGLDRKRALLALEGHGG